MNTEIVIVFVFIFGTLQLTINGKDVNREHFAQIESQMNKSADPCVDFYEYACGNYGQVHNTSEYKEVAGSLNVLYMNEFQRILEDLSNSTLPTEYNFVENTLGYYNSCLSAEKLDSMKILNWIQENENLVWPSVLPPIDVDSSEENEIKSMEENVNRNFSWIETLATLRKYGLNDVFITERVKQYSAQNSIILISPAAIFYTFEDMDIDDVAVIMNFFDIKNVREIDELRREFIKFETELEKLTDLEDRNVRSTLGKLNNTLWVSQYLRHFLGEAYNTDIEVGLINYKYFSGLSTLFQNYESEFICRYIMIRFVIDLEINSPSSFNSTECMKNTLGVLQLSMNWLYEKYNPHLLNDKDKIEIIFKNIIGNFKRVLNENPNQFSNDILEKLHEKADAMVLKLGNLPKPLATEKLKEFYRRLNLTSTEYYENYLRSLSFHIQATHNRLNEKLSQNESYFYMESIGEYIGYTPYYTQISNIVIVPLTILNLPIYDQDLHDIYKYSLFGGILGHEIIHGFDKEGITFNKMGNLSSVMDAVTDSERYSMNLDCLDWKNPDQTAEITGDLSGLILAFETYFTNTSNSNTELYWTPIPPKRLFFLNYAQFFCGATDDTDFEDDEHPSDHKRAFDALANFAEFSRVYDCPLGSPMNPDRKCQIWHST